MPWELIVALLLVLANGFFVAVEFSVARLRPTMAKEMVREGKPGSKSALHAVKHIDSYLSACQLGITVSSLGLGAIGEPAFHDLLEPILGDAATIAGFGLASIVAFLIITTLHVVIGELSPKSLAIARTAPVVLALAPIMRAFYMATKPVVDGFNAMGNLILKPFKVPPASEAGHQPHSETSCASCCAKAARGIDPARRAGAVRRRGPGRNARRSEARLDRSWDRGRRSRAKTSRLALVPPRRGHSPPGGGSRQGRDQKAPQAESSRHS